MFLENDFARPLFDFKKGGPPKAFECLMITRCEVCLESPCSHHHSNSNEQCKKITRTERGMRMHLKTVHDWQEQPCLYSTDKEILRNRRKVNQRMSDLNRAVEKVMSKTTKRFSTKDTEPDQDHQPALLQLTEPEKKETKSLLPTREEN